MPAHALDLIDDKLQLFGFAKDLATVQNPTVGRTTVDNLTRLRPGLRWNIGEAGGVAADLEAVYELRLTVREGGLQDAGAASGLGGVSGFLSQESLPRVVDAESAFEDSEHALGVHELDRLVLAFHHEHARLSVGRQAVSWGVGYLWSPEDRFVPFATTEIDRTEKRGIDAVLATLYPSDLSEIQFVYVPQPRGLGSRHARGGVRATTNVRGYDVSAVFGYFARDWMFGGDLRGPLGDATLRLEATYTLASPEARAEDVAVVNAQVPPGLPPLDGPRRPDFLELVAGVDYGVGDLTVIVEYYFNGEGARDPEDALFHLPALARGETTNLRRHYLGATLQYDVTPLLRLTQTAILAMEPPVSALSQTKLTYNLLANLDVEAGANWTLGSVKRTDAASVITRSEYQNYPDIGYLKVEYFF